ncbi:MAG TPA: phosphatase PAP2 family protein [Bacteroidota bacterium]|nr:phosphatase PAP2 family protein [Bacteroidota bacterium]
MKLRTLFAPLNSADFITVTFLSFLTLLNLIFHTRVAEWALLSTLNILAIALIFILAYEADTRKTPLLMQLHRWYLYGAVLLVFKELYLMVRPIHPVDYDWLLIEIDRWVFGVNPTEWLSQYAHPIVTEILQIGYSSYYLLFIILGIDVYRRQSWKGFDTSVFLIVYGFYLSYIGYFLLPAVGPRFTLHSFELLNQELPGLLLTEPLRAFVNWGESVPTHVPNPVDFVQRDVFPSGHTQLTLVILYCAFHYKLPTRWFLTVMAILLIVGTVYLRYHYVIDLFAGVLFFLFTVWSGWRIMRWWEGWRGRSELETHLKTR